jgi:hypothetical protein
MLHRHLRSAGALILLAAAPAAAQCTPTWLTPPPPLAGSSVYALFVWDPDGPGPAPPVLAAGGRLTSGVYLWDGSAWSIPGGGPGGTPAVYAINQYGGDLLVGGSFRFPGNADDFHVARWNGATWTLMGEQIVATAFAYDATSQLIAATGVTGPAFRWTGSAWEGMDVRSSNWGTSVIRYEGSIIVGGGVYIPMNNSSFGAVRWNGSAWEGLGSNGPPAVTSYTALAIYQGDLIASVIGSPPLRWDGSAWLSMGYPVTGSAALAVYRGDLLAGTDALYRYNGSAWQPLGQLDGGIIYALAEFDGDLYIGGSFTAAAGIPAGHIARFFCRPCYPNCDASPVPFALNVNDFICFQSRFAAADSYADCNHDSAFNVNDFVCFQAAFAAGCP